MIPDVGAGQKRVRHVRSDRTVTDDALVLVEPGYCPALCAAARVATPDRAFLNAGWYASESDETACTLSLRRLGIRLINWGCGDSGYKRELGAVAGPALLDCLVVRDFPGLLPIARRFWTDGA